MSSFTLDAGLRQIARAQLGLLTQRQAAEMGADKHALARRRATGALVELVPGVALVDPVTPSIEQLILAAGLAVPGSILTGSSGAILQSPRQRQPCWRCPDALVRRISNGASTSRPPTGWSPYER